MTAENFWIWWLKITMTLVILAGVMLLGTYYLGFTDFIDYKFEQANRAHSITPEQLDIQKQWMIPIAGSVMILWGGFMLHVARHAFKERKIWAWRAIFYPVLLWYLLDNTASLYYGVLFDLAINTILFFQLVAPLLFLYNSFFSTKKVPSS